MSTPEAVLKKISSSIESPSKKKADPVAHTAFKAKLDAMKQLDPNLFTLFRICDAILVYVDKQQRYQASIDKFEATVNAFTVKFDANQRKIDSAQAALESQIKTRVTPRLNLMEAKLKRRDERIDRILDELERVLRQM